MASPSRTNSVEQSPQRQASGVLATSNRQPANAGIYGDILGLQRTAGNMAVRRLLRSHTGGTGEDAPPFQAGAPPWKENHGRQAVRGARTARFSLRVKRHYS